MHLEKRCKQNSSSFNGPIGYILCSQGTRPTSNWTPCYRINSTLRRISHQEKRSIQYLTRTHGSNPVKLLKAPAKTYVSPPEVVDKLFMKMGSHGQMWIEKNGSRTTFKKWWIYKGFVSIICQKCQMWLKLFILRLI